MAAADELLLDPTFETLSSPEPAWIASDSARVEAEGGVLHVRSGGGFLLVSQDVDVRGLGRSRLLEWSCDVELVRLASGRGAWISLQFSDAHERRLGTRTSDILAMPHIPLRLVARTLVPEGTRRASVVLVTHGDTEAVFQSPAAELRESPAPPVWEGAGPVVLTEGPSVPGRWLGLGLSVDAAGMEAGRVRMATPRVLRALVPWSILSTSGPPDLAALGPMVTAISKMAPGERHVILVPSGGDASHYTDPLRAAAALRFLVDAVRQELDTRGEGAEIRWYVSPATRPDALQHLDLMHYRDCIEELAPILPADVPLAGPFESAGSLWTESLREVFLARGSLLASDVTIPRRDLALAPADLESRALSGVELCVVDVTTDHPDAAPYLGSPRNHLDAFAVLFAAARAGIRIPMLAHSLTPPASVVTPLFRAARAGPVAATLALPEGAALSGLVVREPVENIVALLLLNQGLEALSVDIQVDFGATERQLKRTEMLESSGLQATESEVRVLQGKLADVVPGSSLVIYDTRLQSATPAPGGAAP